MDLLTCTINLKFEHKFKLNDKKFQLLFEDAIKSKPNLMAFDIDFNFSGLEESSLALGIQIEPDVIESGNYAVKNLVNDEFIINANLKANVELAFMSEKHSTAFKNSIKDNKLVSSIASICNNGANKKSYWSMECVPYITLKNEEIQIEF
jgi:hypothetical protein